jgi:sugar phosphate isomerase/epimerase
MKNRKVILILLLPLIAVFIFFSFQKALTPEKLGWKMAYQAYTFRNFTFEESLQKASGLGLKYVEAYPGQKLAPNNPAETRFTADAATRKEMKRLLKQYKIELINYGVVRGKDENEWKQIFDFAKEMGIKTITAEAAPSQFDFIEKMCDNYKINIAIHNHPSPSQYWHPDSVLTHVAGRSQRIGACPDIGHWVRSGVDPVEALRKLKGRVISIHFKDVNTKSRDAHDVIWGTGLANVPGVLQELKDQGFKGVFSIEYEYNWDNSVPDIAESLKNFREITAKLK